ncbi:hypothetical protein [Salinispora arenicola]|uniref:hypothetical protein n=1 Tax=Salinispora arenicola TaxID=168697 RepID=UPI0003A17B89|nr:hypothetical protein [Salinispora arenicola]
MDIRTTPDGALHLEVPASYAPALGTDGALMLDWVSSALIALARLRDQDEVMTAGDWYSLINDLEYRLAPRLQGLRDALIRAHADAGGSYGALALAMDVSKSTAQYRRDRLVATEPSTWELWATGTLPSPAPADTGWSARLGLARSAGSGPDDQVHTEVQLRGLTADQAAELETLLTDDPQHTVTVTTARGSHTFAASDVQVVQVSRTVTR